MISFDAREYWDFENPSTSRSRFESLLGKYPTSIELEIKAQIARTYSLEREFESANVILDNLQSDPNLENHPRAHGCYLLERGRCLRDTGNIEKAQSHFQLATTLGDSEIRIDALHMLALLEEPEKAVIMNQSALAECLASNVPSARRWAGSLYNNLGWGLFELGRTQEALQSFQSALKERVESGSRIDSARWCVARCLRAMGEHDEAVEILMLMDQSDPNVIEEIELNRKNTKL